MSRYPRDVKDKMWKEILVDELCFITDDYEKKKMHKQLNIN